jgi:hypothetical protein
LFWQEHELNSWCKHSSGWSLVLTWILAMPCVSLDRVAVQVPGDAGPQGRGDRVCQDHTAAPVIHAWFVLWLGSFDAALWWNVLMRS